MSIIADEILKRESVYSNLTKNIIALFKEKLDKAIQYYLKDERAVDWFYLEIVKDAPTFVYIMGYLHSKIGDIIKYPDGTKFTVTEENISECPVNSIRIMFPIKILEEGTALELNAKIKDYMTLTSLMKQDEIITALQDVKAEEINDVLKNEQIVDKVTRPKEFMGFDLINLTEYQMASLISNSKNIKEESHH